MGTGAAIREVTAVGSDAWLALVGLHLVALGCAALARLSGLFDRGRVHLWLFGMTLQWGAPSEDSDGGVVTRDREESNEPSNAEASDA